MSVIERLEELENKINDLEDMVENMKNEILGIQNNLEELEI